MERTAITSLRDGPAITLGLLGLVSGVLSATVGMDYAPSWLKPIGSIFFLEGSSVPIGAFYGIAVGVGVALWAGRAWAVPVLMVTTMVAWSAAINTAIPIQGTTGTNASLVRTLAAGLAAGAVGAGITHLGASVFAAALRQPLRIVLTVAVGTVCGLLYFLGDREVVPAWSLYVIWQPAVAFTIGLGLARRSVNS